MKISDNSENRISIYRFPKDKSRRERRVNAYKQSKCKSYVKSTDPGVLKRLMFLGNMEQRT